MKPYNIQIELVEGCNRMCHYCGIHGIWKHKRHRQINRMDWDLAVDIAAELGTWFDRGKRIEFAMHGEPTLHSKLNDIVALFRYTNPKAQLQVTSNGLIPLQRGVDYVTALFDAGLNILILDTYIKRDKLVQLAHQCTGIEVVDYYDEADRHFNPYHYKGPKGQTIVLMDDLAERDRQRPARKVLNHAGNANPAKLAKLGVQPLVAPLIKQCSRPFREIVVHWDGSVPLCCMDWKHEFIVGVLNVSEGSLRAIWDKRIFNVARHFLYNKQRVFRPCYKCDYNGGFRLGLLEPPEVSEPDLEEVKRHLHLMAYYAHPNAAEEPFMYDEGQSGIRRLL